MATIGNRIKAERLRLKYSQDAFGDAACVGKHSQIRYEKGERSPDGDYFAAIDALGADVQYIITGKRKPYVVAQDGTEYITPALKLASEVAAMTLSESDADLLLAMARRLDKRE